MSSDLRELATTEREPKKAAGRILRQEIEEGKQAIDRPAGQLFLSGLSAGLDIGFSVLLLGIVVTELDEQMPPIVSQGLRGGAYAAGFIFVVIGRSELFTEQTTLAVLPVLNGKSSIPALLRTWLIVYVANLLGAAAFAGLVVLVGPALGIIAPRAFDEMARTMVQHPAPVVFLSAILAGWLMGLLSWLVAASRDTVSQIILVGIVATAIGFAHLHHVIVGSVEVLAGVFGGEHVTLGDFGYFLLWTTLGNAIGGPLFVALIKYGHAMGSEVAAGAVAGGG